jgi:hypothetical protein
MIIFYGFIIFKLRKELTGKEILLDYLKIAREERTYLQVLR